MTAARLRGNRLAHDQVRAGDARGILAQKRRADLTGPQPRAILLARDAQVLATWDLRRSASRRRTGRSRALTLDYLTLCERSLGRYPEIIEDHVRGIVAR